MATIKFSYPLPMGKDAYEQYAQAGLYFGGLREANEHKDAGFTQVRLTVDPDRLAENLSTLSREAIQHLVPSLVHSEIGPALKKAEALWQLDRMGEKSASGYAFGFLGTQPKTWGLQDSIGEELSDLQEKLSRHGITEVRVGQELEFSLPEEPVEGFGHWQEVKQEIIRELEHAVAGAEGEARTTLEAKLAETRQLNAREVLMYDMIERDARTKDILEPLFGRTRDGDGYYDGQNCLELKLNHCPVAQYSERQQTVLSVLVEKAREYGLPLYAPPSSHLNFSFWDEKGNLMHASHPDYATKGKVIAEGITHGMADALPLTMDDIRMKSGAAGGKTVQYAANREGLLRAATGRLEVRPGMHAREQHTDLMIVPVLAGALSALENQHRPAYAQEYKQARMVGSGSFEKPRDALKVFTHVLSNSEIHPDGSLTVPEDYVIAKAEDLAYNLGLIDREPQPHQFQMFAGKEDYADSLLEFIKHIRIDRSGTPPRIVFPQNCPQGYAFQTPEINLNKIPAPIAEKIRSGVEPRTLQKEWYGYITPGDRIPEAAKHYTIDTDALAKNVSLSAIEERLVITDGYAIAGRAGPDEAPDKDSVSRHQVERLKSSPVFADTLSPDFHASLIASVEASIPVPPLTVETVSQERKEEVKALLKAACETQLLGKSGDQKINFAPANYRTFDAMQALKTEVVAVLCDMMVQNQMITAAEREVTVLDISRQIEMCDRSRMEREGYEGQGNYLFFPAQIIDKLLPLIQVDPDKLEHYKAQMGVDIEQEMRDITASLQDGRDSRRSFSSQHQKRDPHMPDGSGWGRGNGTS